MIGMINQVYRQSNTVHREQLKQERKWLTEWARDPKGNNCDYGDLQLRHHSVHTLLWSIIESLGDSKSEELSRALWSKSSRANQLISCLANPGTVSRRMKKVTTRRHRDSPDPIFVISSWRSGSTLLMLMLGAHKNLTALPEMNLLGPFLAIHAENLTNGLPILLRNRPTIIDAFNGTRNLGIKEEEFYKHFALFLNSVISNYVMRQSGRRWVYKESAHADSLPLIDLIFGYRSRFIWLVRHGLDVVNSHIERYERWGIQRPDPADYAHEWVTKNNLLADFWERTQDRCLKVHYEQLVSNAPSEARRIVQFLGEPWDDNLFASMKTSTQYLGGDYKLVASRGKFYSSRIGLWTNWPEAYIKQLGAIVNPMLRRAGYDAVKSPNLEPSNARTTTTVFLAK